MAYGIREGEKEALEVEKEAKFGVWKYYTNEENKPRWKCSCCGKVIRHGAHEKLYCPNCGAKMKTEA